MKWLLTSIKSLKICFVSSYLASCFIFFFTVQRISLVWLLGQSQLPYLSQIQLMETIGRSDHVWLSWLPLKTMNLNSSFTLLKMFSKPFSRNTKTQTAMSLNQTQNPHTGWSFFFTTKSTKSPSSLHVLNSEIHDTNSQEHWKQYRRKVYCINSAN